jgi:hypothetical protein
MGNISRVLVVASLVFLGSFPIPEASAVASNQIAKAYQIAKTDPKLLQAMFCYCGCDNTGGHGSLLDCFKDDHGKSCGICIAEAIMAAKLKKSGMSLGQIKKQLDSSFSHSYPYKKQSQALKKYKGVSGKRADRSPSKPGTVPDCCRVS